MSLDSVTLRIGEPGVAVDTFMYREILTVVSPYFRSVFEGAFKEATERFLTLTDVSEQTFRIFLQWAHMSMGEQSSKVSVLHPGLLLRDHIPQTKEQGAVSSGDTEMGNNQNDSHAPDHRGGSCGL
jgi:hypothetical protein